METSENQFGDRNDQPFIHICAGSKKIFGAVVGSQNICNNTHIQSNSSATNSFTRFRSF